MGIYIGLADSSKEISGVYLGAEESAKEVSDGYIGDADGNVQQIYTGVKPGQQVFTTSGTFIVPKGVKSVDVFLVGAGGAGGYEWSWLAGGNGGGGGYTTTVKGISVSAKEEYPIVVGAGTLGDGGSSSGFNNIANGGYEGHSYSSDSINKYPNLANGGSGGGWAGGRYSYPGAGGSDGSNGWSGAASNWDATVWSSLNGGKGKGLLLGLLENRLEHYILVEVVEGLDNALVLLPVVQLQDFQQHQEDLVVVEMEVVFGIDQIINVHLE